MVLERRRLQFVLYNQGRITSRVLLAEGERVVGAPLDRVLGGALVGFLLDRPVPDTPEQFFDLLLVVPQDSIVEGQIGLVRDLFPRVKVYRCTGLLGLQRHIQRQRRVASDDLSARLTLVR